MSLLDDEPRIVIVSQRSYYTPVFRTSAYEFEDVICAVDHADLLLPTFETSPLTQRLLGKISQYGSICVEPKRRRPDSPRLTRYYDVLFVNVCDCHELLDLEPILECLRERCRVVICNIEDYGQRAW